MKPFRESSTEQFAPSDSKTRKVIRGALRFAQVFKWDIEGKQSQQDVEKVSPSDSNEAI